MRRVLAAAALLLIVLLALARCQQTLLLGRVRELVLTGQWDEGIFDKSIFGE